MLMTLWWWGAGGFAHLPQPNIGGHQLVLLILKQNPQMVFLELTREYGSH